MALGLRIGEVVGLYWDDVDLDAATLRVQRQLQRYGGDPVARRSLRADRKRLLAALIVAKASRNADQCKTLRAQLADVRARLRAIGTTLHFVDVKTERSRREIALPPIVVRSLRAHRQRQLEERLRAGGSWTENNLVFATPIGTPLEPRSLKREYDALLASSGLPTIRFQDLRHTAATLLLAQGVGLRTVMEVLGHSQISTTANVYSHILSEMKKDAADKMDAVLKDEQSGRDHPRTSKR